MTQHPGTAQTGPSSTRAFARGAAAPGAAAPGAAAPGAAAPGPAEASPAEPGDVVRSGDAATSEDPAATVDAVDGWDDAQLVGQLFSLAVGTHSARGITVDEPDSPDDSVTTADGGHPAATDGVRRTPVDALADLVAARHIGGVCYFPETAEGDSPDAIRHLVRRLQQAASAPLLVSADQENGTVSRLRQGSTRLPSAQALAAADDVALTEEVARTSGTELRATGIRHAFAPVADLAVEPRNPVIGVRSPGADPQAAARQVSATVRGLAAAGVASTLKHFPGHGSTTVDSHLGLPVLELTRDAWERQERAVFAAGIAAGVDAVMIGHLVFPAVDAGTPATYSRAVVTGELREALGFDGVIVTDALDMAGAQLADGPGAGAVAALAAGVDQLLMPGDPEAAIDAVLAALADGVLSRDALRDSARRILRLKERLGLAGDGIDVEAPLATPQHASTAERAARASLVWRDPSTTWVLDPGAPGTRVLVVGLRTDPQLRGVDVSAVLADRLGAAGAQVWTEPLDDDPDTILAAATRGFGGSTPDVLVIATRDAWRDPEQSRHLGRLLALATETGTQACVVATRSPSDSSLVPDDVPLLLTFGDVTPSARAAGDALAGAAAATGVLPVDLVGADGHLVRRHTSPAPPPHPSEETRS
ncbi:glycoside hydrolase family 3 protein [Sanguibacter inulinus]|uniref:glycoside hydrolase family 3 protein n=1 Tax=Sanguibacter inulinus TaxID=60922 RepID=UPI003619213E